MRDIALTVFFLGLLPFIFKRPYIGALVWAWLSMMNPHKLTFGFAYSLPFAYITALVTLSVFLFTQKKYQFPWNGVTRVHLTFLLWMCVTSFFAMNTPQIVGDRMLFVAKIQLMIFVTLMLIRGREQIEHLIWVITFSVGFYGIKGGIWTVTTGGGGRVWGPPGGMIEGNNELGLALVILLPFMYYLHQVAQRKWLRYALMACLTLMVFSILGSQSRGALLGLLAMAFVLGLKGNKPVQTSLILIALLAAAVAFMPDSWTDRMDTITSYQEDGSAMSRIYTWKTLWNLALDRPLVGAGFATDNPIVFARYAPAGVGNYTAGGAIFVAHSIYFQALGEHGFPGLFLYVMLGVMTWRMAGRLARECKDDPEYASWVPLLMRMAQVSLIGFATGGAFLTLVHFDLPYYIVAIVVLVAATVRERKNKPGGVGSAMPDITQRLMGAP
ncbi:MAG TPA: putative O-glycosylation ligase, exosortase A system-associated [Burkholderiaceae bacterium]